MTLPGLVSLSTEVVIGNDIWSVSLLLASGLVSKDGLGKNSLRRLARTLACMQREISRYHSEAYFDAWALWLAVCVCVCEYVQVFRVPTGPGILEKSWNLK